MGTESGESLDFILRRKEFERRANKGYFLWGVGNSVLAAMEQLFEIESCPRVVFSRMRSKPKPIDVTPQSLLVWLGAENVNGSHCELPPYSLLISRGSLNAGMPRRSHYALVCYSEAPLGLNNGDAIRVENSSLANMCSGRKLGASQVTAVVSSQQETRDKQARKSWYSAELITELASPGQVRLKSAVSMDATIKSKLDRAVHEDNYDEWKRLVVSIRQLLSQTDLHNEYEMRQTALAL